MPDETDGHLVVHGIPASQPSRSVFWVLLYKELPFEIAPPDRSLEGRSALEALNPRKLVPIIEEGDFVLHEMAAILAYLASEHGWEDLYPRDLRRRALVDQYLHFHHMYTRLATHKLMGPHVTIAFGGGPPEESTDAVMKETINAVIASGDKIATGRPAVDLVLDLIERSFFRVEGKACAFLCSEQAPTIADFACYEELAQLEWARLHDFSDWARLAPWLEHMSKLPFHDAVHSYNFALGDIVSEQNTLERFEAANAAGLEALRAAGASLRW